MRKHNSLGKSKYKTKSKQKIEGGREGKSFVILSEIIEGQYMMSRINSLKVAKKLLSAKYNLMWF